MIRTDSIVSKQKKILLKPNLINTSPHPITTPVECCESVVEYIRNCSDCRIIIAEGCGDASSETNEIFHLHGYTKLAKRYDIELVDLNTAPLVKLENNSYSVFPEIYLPEIVFGCFLVSIPVLKAHSLANITGALKNMIGLAPPKYYSGQYGSWKKSVFHGSMQQSIIELNLYRSPDLSIMDASVGMAEYHLGGPACNPPIKKIIAGFDPLEVDRISAQLLSVDWKNIPHLAVPDGHYTKP